MKSNKGHKGKSNATGMLPTLLNQTLLTEVCDLIIRARGNVAWASNA